MDLTRRPLLVFQSIALTMLLASCSLFDDGKAAKPDSHGRPNEIVIVGNESQMSGPLGDSIKAIVGQKIPWILQEEQLFRVYQISPVNLTQFFKSFRNVLLIHTFDDQSQDGQIIGKAFSEELIERHRKDPNYCFASFPDRYANNQHFYLLFAENETDLLNYIRSNKKQIETTLVNNELKKIKNAILTGKTNTLLEETVKKRTGASMRLLGDFKVATDTVEFLWLRDINNSYDRNIIISWENYMSQEQFSPMFVREWRDRLGKSYIFGSGQRDTTSYMVREELEPSTSIQVRQNNRFAVKTHGLWRLKNFARGGSYTSLVTLDETEKRVYYVEAFVYAPGSMKRDVMREMEAMLMTFK